MCGRQSNGLRCRGGDDEPSDVAQLREVFPWLPLERRDRRIEFGQQRDEDPTTLSIEPWQPLLRVSEEGIDAPGCLGVGQGQCSLGYMETGPASRERQMSEGIPLTTSFSQVHAINQNGGQRTDRVAGTRQCPRPQAFGVVTVGVQMDL